MTEQQFTTEELNSEEWKQAFGFPKYEVSTLGRVRRPEPCKGRPSNYIMRQRPSGMGYLTVCLQGPNGERGLCVHRLMAQTFLGVPKPGQTQANHKDGNKQNNRLGNLEWVSPKENTRHSIEVLGNDHSGENHAMVKLTANQVIEIHNRRMAGEAANYIAQFYGVRKITVLRILHRRTWAKTLAHLPTDYPPAIHYGKRGENSWKAKITNETASQIKIDIAAGINVKEIAAKYDGVTLDIVNNIKHGQSWKHVL